MSLHSMGKLIASLTFFACASACATQITVGTGIFPDMPVQSIGVLGDPANTTADVFLGANATINTIFFNVNLTAFEPSTLDEISLAVTDITGANGTFFTPAGGLDNSNGNFSGSIDLIGQNVAFALGSDGFLHLEFFEAFDNLPGADGLWNFGTVTFDYTVPAVPAGVPEPATGALMAAGLGIMVYAGRRRHASRASRATPTLH